MNSAEPNLATVKDLQPQPVWRAFAELAAVPRPSKKEEHARAHARAWATAHKFAFREDDAGNIVIDVPATPGCEQAPVTTLQGHLDMVCEKNAGTTHEFERDPIRLVIDQDKENGQAIVRAAGTTLGADNGLGVALAMAAATEPDVRHGPLELLLTIDEEMGMTGAKALAPGWLRGRRLLNLDTEEDDHLCIGCAGGCDTSLIFTLAAAPPPAKAELCRVSVSGLRGGHSGVDIHLNHVNALKLLGRVLTAPWADSPKPGRLQLADLRGGTKRNVIPREASAVVAGPRGTLAKLVEAAKQAQADAIAAGEPTAAVSAERAVVVDAPAVLSVKDTARLLTTLTAMPHGVLAVVPEIPGFVQTSNSTSTAETTRVDGQLRIVLGCLSRSSKFSELQATARQLAAIGRLAGAAVESGGAYPGWAPNVNSALLATCRRIYEQLFGQPPHVGAVHAGLECGIIGDRVAPGEMDMISLGPLIKGAHSPDERVYIATVEKTWRFLKAILAELAR